MIKRDQDFVFSVAGWLTFPAARCISVEQSGPSNDIQYRTRVTRVTLAVGDRTWHLETPVLEPDAWAALQQIVQVADAISEGKKVLQHTAAVIASVKGSFSFPDLSDLRGLSLYEKFRSMFKP